MGNRISREELLSEIHRLHDEYGKATTTLLREHGNYSSRTYSLRFGSWTDALNEAGLEPNREQNISDEDLLAELRKLANELDRTPTMADMDETARYSHGPYQTRFGSWNEAIEKAGLTPNKKHDISDEDLIAEMQRLTGELGRAPKRSEMNDRGKYSGAVYTRRFGTWSEGVEAAGLEVPAQRKQYTNEDLLEELRRLSDSNSGKIPTWTDMQTDGKMSAKIVSDRFGSWREALIAAGFEVPTRWSEVDAEDLCEELEELATRVQRVPRRKDVTEHSEFQPDWFAKEFGSWNEALRAAGFEPTHIHNVSDSELLAELESLADELDRTPRQSDVVENGRFSVSLYKRRFGSWNDALEECGFQPVHRYNIGESELLDALNDLATELDRTPKAREMDEVGKFSTPPYFDRFGSWIEALEAAGLETPLSFEDVSCEQLLDEIERIAESIDGIPKIFDIRKHSTIKSKWYYREFDSWNQALRNAGFEPHRNHDVSNESLVAELQRVADELGRTPTINDIVGSSDYDPALYIGRFDSWNEALRAADLEPSKRSHISDDELKEEFYRLKEALGHVPSGAEMNELGTFSAAVYNIRYGGWNEAVRKFGEEPRYVSPGEGDSQSYGPLWEKRREEIIQRDGEECVICGFERDTHMHEFGRDLNVHHINRFLREYERTTSFEVAHRHSNLVTLCVQCHSDAEGMPKAYFKQFVSEGVLDETEQTKHHHNPNYTLNDFT
ncbi:homing endonuclease associated repeat-containing protein [Halosimplex sp. TS25]|uniref:homing endonuclease associated repeat-containing protein n=1 Tax=Halosimplex rarum TaxID=3396619 RepID=UPI0039EC9761